MSTKQVPTPAPLRGVSLSQADVPLIVRVGQWFPFWGTLVLLGGSPYFRGLYFGPNQLAALSIALGLLAVAAVYAAYEGRSRFISTPLEWALAALVGAFLLSWLVAVSPRGALQAVLVHLLWFVVFVLVVRVSTNADRARWLTVGLAYTAAVWGVFGVFNAAGYLHFPAAWVAHRLNSVYQYPDSAGATFLFGLFISLGLWVRARTRAQWLAYSAPAALLFAPFIASFSRGAWLIAPFVAAIFIILLPRGERLRGTLKGLAVLVGGTLGVALFLKGTENHQAAEAVLSEAGALLLTWAVGHLTDLFQREKIATQRAVGFGLIGIIVVGMAAYAVRSSRQPLTLSTTPAGQVAAKETPAAPVLAGRTYTLTARIDATAPPKAAAWQVIVQGITPRGDKATLLQTSGPATRGFVTRRFTFKTQALENSLLVQIQSGAKGSTATYQNVHVFGPDLNARPSFFWAKILPGSIYNRAVAINPDQLSVWERGFFYANALKMVAARPILGWGGGGWAAAYFAYQSFDYFTTQVHNEYFQVWVDAGTVGFLVYLGVWLAFLWLLYRGMKTLDRETRILLAGLGSAVLALGAHSAIDFDLSLTAIALLMVAAMAVVQTLVLPDSGAPQVTRSKRGVVQRPPWAVAGAVITCLAAVVIGTFALVLRSGDLTGAQAAQLLTEHHLNRALPLYDQAINADPLVASFYGDRGQIEAVDAAQAKTPNTQLLQSAQTDMATAARLAPTNSKVLLTYGVFLFDHGQTSQGLAQIRAAIHWQPLDIQTYSVLAEAYTILAVQDLQRTGAPSADHYARLVLSVGAQATRRVNAMPGDLPANLHVDPDPPSLALYQGEAAALLGDTRVAIPQLLISLQGAAESQRALEWLAGLGQITHNAFLLKTFAPQVAKNSTEQAQAGAVAQLLAKTGHYGGGKG